MRVTIDKAGRVVIPKQVRDELGLVAGTELNLEQEGDKLTLATLPRKSRMYRKNGVLVFRGEGTLTVEDVNRVVEEMREERHRLNLGDFS